MHLEYEMVFAAIERDRGCKIAHSHFVSTFLFSFSREPNDAGLRIAFLLLVGLYWEGTLGSRIHMLTSGMHLKARLQMATGLPTPLLRLTLPMEVSRLVFSFCGHNN